MPTINLAGICTSYFLPVGTTHVTMNMTKLLTASWRRRQWQTSTPPPTPGGPSTSFAFLPSTSLPRPPSRAWPSPRAVRNTCLSSRRSQLTDLPLPEHLPRPPTQRMPPCRAPTASASQMASSTTPWTRRSHLAPPQLLAARPQCWRRRAIERPSARYCVAVGRGKLWPTRRTRSSHAPRHVATSYSAWACGWLCEGQRSISIRV